MKRTETAAALNKNIPLPKNRYAIQCIEEEFKESGKGNMMIVRKWEIIEPSTINFQGQEISIAGVQILQYLTTVVFKDDGNGGKTIDLDKVKAMMPRVFEDYKRLGLPCEDIDEMNPHLGAKGLVAAAILNSKEYTQTMEPTPEQLKKGMKVGDPIKDEGGKLLKGYQVNIQEILGLSKVKPIVIAE